jgi:hypothetical protein
MQMLPLTTSPESDLVVRAERCSLRVYADLTESVVLWLFHNFVLENGYAVSDRFVEGQASWSECREQWVGESFVNKTISVTHSIRSTFIVLFSLFESRCLLF